VVSTNASPASTPKVRTSPPSAPTVPPLVEVSWVVAVTVVPFAPWSKPEYSLPMPSWTLGGG